MFLVVAGLGAGFINTLAGGGSLLTLPALMLVGLPADVANGTNRVGILLQSVAASVAFDREKAMLADKRELLGFVWPTVVGAALGALSAASIPRATLKPVLLATMVGMAVLIAFRPKLLAPGPEEVALLPSQAPRARWGLFATGLYGGFLQAGVGFLFLVVLAGMLRHPLATANAIKVVIVAVLTVIALTIFVVAGQVEWIPGLVCGAGAVVGGVLGVRMATRASAKALRFVVLAAVLAASTKLAFF